MLCFLAFQHTRTNAILCIVSVYSNEKSHEMVPTSISRLRKTWGWANLGNLLCSYGNRNILLLFDPLLCIIVNGTKEQKMGMPENDAKILVL